jgi:ribosomal protein S14
MILRSLKKSRVISYTKRYQASYYLSTLEKRSSANYSVNRCIVTGRVWSVNKSTKYSRFVLRSEISNSNIPGFRRAS